MIHHVTLEVPPASLQHCIDFYACFGFEPVPAPDGIAGRAVWLQTAGRCPGQQVHLMPVADALPSTGHFAIVCPDYQDILERLRAAGHEVEPRRRHWGSRRAFVRDPAGHLVELMAWAPGDSRQ